MRRKLFQVEESSYTVSGRLLLAARTEKETLDFKQGDHIILIKPDGTEIETQIGAANRFKIVKSYVESVLLDGLKREDAPVGTTGVLNTLE